jgi:hypothetical protein
MADNPCTDGLSSPAADKTLAEHILVNHITRLTSAWESAVIQCLMRVKGDLCPRQAEVLQAFWRRL